MSSKFKTRNFDLIEVTPPSTPALKGEIENILGDSQELSAAVESLNSKDGSFRLVLQGKLRPSSDKGATKK